MGNLAKRGPLSSVGDLLVNTKKKNWEIVVIPDVNGYTKTSYQQSRKIPRNVKRRQPTKNQLKE